MPDVLVIYVAGPYSAPTPEGIAANVAAAAQAGQEILRRGHVPLVPHTMTHNWDVGTGLTYEQFIDADLELLRRCDGIYMLPGWIDSRGAQGEWVLARELGLGIFYFLDKLPALST